MQLKTLTLTVVTLLLATLTLSAQTSVSNFDLNLTSNDDEALEEVKSDTWTFYQDKERKIYYIDFETINVNLNEIIVRNSRGEVVFKDELWGLPVNTIYELDFSKYKPGRYEVELKSFISYMKKELIIE